MEMKAISSSATHGTDQGDGHQWVWRMVWRHRHHAGVGLWLCCVDGLLFTNPFFSLTLIHPLTPHQPLITTIPSIPCVWCVREETRVVMVIKGAPSHWIGNINTRTSAMLSICTHTHLPGFLAFGAALHTFPRVCGMKGGTATITTSTPHVAHTYTSETVTGGTPHACPCFIHSMACATTTTLRDTSEAWWHQHTHLYGSAVWCVWPMCCHSCLHHHLHPPITSPQFISLCHAFTHVCVTMDSITPLLSNGAHVCWRGLCDVTQTLCLCVLMCL